MEKQAILATLKENYNRDLRKQVVKTILSHEKEHDNPDYQIINKIFAYVLTELNWNMADHIEEWDNTPLDIMEEAFPKLETSKWFEIQIREAKKSIEALKENLEK